MQDFNKLYSKIKIDKFPFPLIDTGDILTGIGSCFTQKFLENLASLAVDCTYNPSGIIYNLHSINEIITYAKERKVFQEQDLMFFNDYYISLSHHGNFSAKTIEETLTKCNQALEQFRLKLESSKFCIITPSSSLAYRYKPTQQIVANCHKINNNEFTTEFLSTTANYQLLKEIIASILTINSSCKIIFSLSPIRHYPGNLLLNSRSKSNLLSAIYQICEEYSNDCTYFPAYEIVNDELRDYRFYSADLLHLTDTTQALIFERFLLWASTEKFREYIKLKKAEKITHYPNK